MTEDELKWLEEFNLQEKKQTSYTGGFLFTEPSNPDPIDNRYKFDTGKVFELGGLWLVTLYMCNSNIDLAAQELKIKPNTLRKRLLRLKNSLNKQGISPNNLYNKLKKG